MEVRESACPEIERRDVDLGHSAVEDDARICTPLVCPENVDDRGPADLLLPIAGDANVHGERALRSEKCGCFQEQIEISLVVARAPAVQPFLANLGLERRRIPEGELTWRLDIEVSVDENRRRDGRVPRGTDLTDRKRVAARLDEFACTTRRTDEIADPLPGGTHVVGVRGISADARDAEPGGELLEPGWIRRRHAGESTRPSSGSGASARAFSASFMATNPPSVVESVLPVNGTRRPRNVSYCRRWVTPSPRSSSTK